MAIERHKFQKLGGFDESFMVCGSDVDLCIRAFRLGLVNVYVAEARLIHHESKTRDPRAIPAGDFLQSERAYAPYRIEGDPYYNPNLSVMSCLPELRGAH
jgi:GT2 family glycosyltransferase